jgi:signal transduction histidine kinase
MTHSAAAVTAEALTERLPMPEAADEVRELAVAFNATLDRLEAAFKRQRRFTADASHELRTPVTAILGQAELALSRPRPPESYQEALRRIQQEGERMQRLIGRMLALARLEAAARSLETNPVNPVLLIQSLIETLQPLAAEKGLQLTVDLPPPLTIITDPDSLTQILLNLFENAIAYTDHGRICLSLMVESDQVCFKIEDTGQGIATEHLPYIFEPFYRTDPGRTSSRSSVGLGLALTKDLVSLLGGTIEVTSRPDVGTTFTVTLSQQPAHVKLELTR